MENIGYYNGKIGLVEEMVIPMNDRSTYFGDGVYDATCVVNHIPFALEEHIDRFFNSVEMVRIPFSMSKTELAALLQELINKVDSPNQIIYWQTTRGTGMRSHAFPDSTVPANLLIYVSPFSAADINQKFKLVTVEDTRYFHCNVKTLNLLPNVMAAQRAAEANCDEAVFCRGDMVTECAHSNILIIKDGILRTAPLSNMILPGVTRKHLLELAKNAGIQVDETAFTKAELLEADEIIVSNSGAFCNAACEVDGIKVGGHAPELLKTLQDAYMAKFRKETKDM